MSSKTACFSGEKQNADTRCESKQMKGHTTGRLAVAHGVIPLPVIRCARSVQPNGSKKR
jgi:hypothetical protein